MRGSYMLTLCLLLNFCSIKENPIVKDTIGFRIVGEEVRVRDGSFEFTAELSNSSDKNFILYAFRRVHQSLSTDSLLCRTPSDEWAGNAIFIIDENGLLNDLEIEVPLHEDSSMAYKPFPDNFLEQLNAKTAAKYKQATEVLYSKSKKEIKLNGKFDFYPLPKGEYGMYLIYYCGDGLTDLIRPEEIKADERKYKAMELKGWIKSNTVKFIVE